MLGWLALGYWLGSPTIEIHHSEPERKLTKKELKAIRAKARHDKTCPNIARSSTHFHPREEMEHIFW